MNALRILWCAVYVFFTRRSLRDGILLLGINDSGKTALFYKLTNNADVKSMSSIIENVGSIKISNKTEKIIDIPGHEKIRNTILSKYKENAKWELALSCHDNAPIFRALLFVLDSQTILANIHDISEWVSLFCYDVQLRCR